MKFFNVFKEKKLGITVKYNTLIFMNYYLDV